MIPKKLPKLGEKAGDASGSERDPVGFHGDLAREATERFLDQASNLPVLVQGLAVLALRLQGPMTCAADAQARMEFSLLRAQARAEVKRLGVLVDELSSLVEPTCEIDF
ncbi:hypothetical protein [Albimonas pacifica]|nr:hypothetical protein [Albimonas pacifica]